MSRYRVAPLVVSVAVAIPSPAIAGNRGWAKAGSAGRDVRAGAGIGLASGVLLTRQHDDRVALTPWSSDGGGGIDLAVRF